MKFNPLLVTAVALLSSGTFTHSALADQTIRCSSQNFQYTQCAIPEHGYVRLQQRTSKASCTQGKSWDYDRRQIWVDDGCAGEFIVETRQHTDSHPDHKGDVAVAAIAGLAILAAAAASSKDNEQQSDNRYSDSNYYHGGHSSYVPGWMIGNFKGYNMEHHKPVRLNISSDGRVNANAAGVPLQGYVNDERLYVGNLEFDIERAGDGFNTIEIGNSRNQVHYERD